MADAGQGEGLDSPQPSSPSASPSEETQNLPGAEQPETSKTESENKSEAETGVKAETETGVKAEIETGVKAEIETGVKAETETGVKAEAETGVKAETETGVKAETETKPGSELTAKTTEAEAGSDAKTEAESETKSESVSETKGDGKVDLILKAAGDAPILRQRLWKVDSAKQVTWVIQFIKRYIKLTPEESLFVYVSQAFSPAPDQTIGNLMACFGSEGKLVLHYCKTQAWG